MSALSDAQATLAALRAVETQLLALIATLNATPPPPPANPAVNLPLLFGRNYA